MRQGIISIVTTLRTFTLTAGFSGFIVADNDDLFLLKTWTKTHKVNYLLQSQIDHWGNGENIKWKRLKNLEPSLGAPTEYPGRLHKFMLGSWNRRSPLFCKFLSLIPAAVPMSRGCGSTSNKHKNTSYGDSNSPEECLIIMLCILATGDVARSWLAVETSDVPYLLNLTSGDLTSWLAGDIVSRLESSSDEPVYTAAPSPAPILAYCESLV